ncbi:glycosyltransferase family 2 protein [Vibrio sp. CJQ_6]|uniref:glycosyltransferase family 2 protein n=1 Tax=Vibrio sp. CJQ_6 TaxID=3367165 RepID=UPI00370BCE76
MGNHKKLTIAIPTFNRCDTVTKNVKQILASCLDFEVIVSDNCSSDGTWHSLQKISDERLKINRNEQNLGFTGNILKLLEMASNDHVFFLSDEDIVESESLYEIWNGIDQKDSVGVVFTNVGTENGNMYNFPSALVTDCNHAIEKYAFTHSYMSGTIFNKRYIDIEGFLKAISGESIILYPHEIFVLQILSRGGYLIVEDRCSCKQGTSLESDVYKIHRYDRFDMRGELLLRYIRVIDKLNLESTKMEFISSSLASFFANVIIYNLRKSNLRYTGLIRFIQDLYKSKLSYLVIMALVKKTTHKILRK